MLITSLCFVFASFVFTAESQRDDYCNVEGCDPSESHTVCRFPNSQPASRCGTVLGTLTQSEKNQILAYHNQQRTFVASGAERRGNPGPQYAAASMPNMTWDKELELVAQRWANQCDYSHDQCRDVDRFGVGQNVGIVATTGNLDDIDILHIPSLWYDEVDQFPRDDVREVQDYESVGHYTQMIWADSEYLGCGAIRYTDSPMWSTLYMVCNYGPNGNTEGEGPYEPN